MTGMWKSARQRLKARITTAARQDLKSNRLAHHSIQIPSSNLLHARCYALALGNVGVACHVSLRVSRSA
jgi:hypothetical protein